MLSRGNPSIIAQREGKGSEDGLIAIRNPLTIQRFGGDTIIKISQQRHHDFDIIADMKKIVLSRAIRKVAVNLSNASWRDFLTGFFDYAKRKTHWDIRVVQSAEELERAAQNG